MIARPICFRLLRHCARPRSLTRRLHGGQTAAMSKAIDRDHHRELAQREPRRLVTNLLLRQTSRSTVRSDGKEPQIEFGRLAGGDPS